MAAVAVDRAEREWADVGEDAAPDAAPDDVAAESADRLVVGDRAVPVVTMLGPAVVGAFEDGVNIAGTDEDDDPLQAETVVEIRTVAAAHPRVARGVLRTFTGSPYIPAGRRSRIL